MGLCTVDIIKILKIIKEHDVQSMCMIGRQNIHIKWKEFGAILMSLRWSYDEKIWSKIFNQNPIDTYDFFRMFGVKEVHALDYDEADGADIIANLNEEMPDEIISSFDLVLNGGTLEHVFDVAKAMKNISSLAKQGGLVVHICPAARYVEHGFYSFSPTFFTDFYTSKAWEITSLEWEFRMTNAPKSEWVAVYSQDCRIFQTYCNWEEWARAQKRINHFMDCLLGVEDIGNVQIWCTVKKIGDKNCSDEYPIQKAYAKSEVVDVYRPKTVDFAKIEKIVKSNSKKVVALYGAGKICEEIIEHLYINDLEDKIDYLFDSNIKRAGEFFRGYRILFPSLTKLNKADVIIICTNRYEEEIRDDLVKLGVDVGCIYSCTS